MGKLCFSALTLPLRLPDLFDYLDYVTQFKKIVKYYSREHLQAITASTAFHLVRPFEFRWAPVCR